MNVSVPSANINPRPLHGFSLNPIPEKEQPIFGFEGHDEVSVEWFYRVYKRMPKKAGRLSRSREAALRALSRRASRYLPPRRAFQTTVDYYESYLPLYAAKASFLNSSRLDNCTRSLIQVCKNILPTKIF